MHDHGAKAALDSASGSSQRQDLVLDVAVRIEEVGCSVTKPFPAAIPRAFPAAIPRTFPAAIPRTFPAAIPAAIPRDVLVVRAGSGL